MYPRCYNTQNKIIKVNIFMAVNTRKRDPIKHVRDKAKSAYEKSDSCHICGSTEELELHHTNSLTLLFEKWAKERGYPLDTDDEVIAVREEFIDDHRSEIYDEVFTLCNKHHLALHRIFGKSPILSTAPKQNNWIAKQKAKAMGLEVEQSSASFSKFY